MARDVQRGEAPLPGELGVSPSFLVFPKTGGRGGQRGRGDSYVTVVADSAPLYPPYTWIPAFAGMTEQGARDLSLPGVWDDPKEVQEKLLPGV